MDIQSALISCSSFVGWAIQFSFFLQEPSVFGQPDRGRPWAFSSAPRLSGRTCTRQGRFDGIRAGGALEYLPLLFFINLLRTDFTVGSVKTSTTFISATDLEELAESVTGPWV